MTGSRVNPRAVVDSFSDFDIEVYVRDLTSYWASDDWLDTHFEPVTVRWPFKPESFKENWLTRLVIFRSGCRIDFQMSDGPLQPDHYINGFQVLLDKDNIVSTLPDPTFAGYQVEKPNEERWQKLTSEFWWECVYVAKALKRDELFYAKFMMESQLRFEFLLPMLEWHTCTLHGWDTQPNKFGRQLKPIIEPKLWRDIESGFAGSDVDDNWRALYNTLALFRQLGQETGTSLGFEYPFKLDKEVSGLIERIRSS